MFLLITIILFLAMILNWDRKRERERVLRSLGTNDNDASAVTTLIVRPGITTVTGLATGTITGTGPATILGPAHIYVRPGAKLGLNSNPDDEDDEADDHENDSESGDEDSASNDEEEKK